MVKLQESKGKTGESYALIFGSYEMGRLFSKLQSSIIRSGFELERILEHSVPESMVTTLEAISEDIKNIQSKPAIQVVFKPTRPDPDNPGKSVEADLLIVDNEARRFSLVEVKEGYVFDTKKSDGELASLKKITSWLAQEYAYRTQYFICSFNQDDKEEIVRGTKKRFTIDHAMTGRELCGLLGVDYDVLREARRVNQTANRHYFFTELLAIPEIRAEISEIIQQFDGSSE